MRDALISGLVTGYAIAIPVGAVAAFIVALTARTSWRVGAGAGLGVATVDGIYATLAVLAGHAIASVVEPIAGTLRIVSGLVLLGIAAITALKAVRRTGVIRDGSGRAWTPFRAWIVFVGITAVNPATVVYFTAIVLGDRAPTDAALESVVFVLAAFLASASWQLTLAAAGHSLGAAISGPKGHRITGLVAAVVIGGLAVQTLLG